MQALSPRSDNSSPDSDNTGNMLQDVITGLSQEPKSLPSKYFYDSLGSQHFDEICTLEEYYPYRTELAMLPAIASDLSHILEEELDIIEFGAGSLVKIRFLLEKLPRVKHFFPIDIAGDHLRLASEELTKDYQNLNVVPVEADFTRHINLPESGSHKKLGFFPGSTIGNFTREDAENFLTNARKTLGQGSLLLIGVDTKKSPEILHDAYNDRAGVTKKFNRNVLHHINREVNANFNPDLFDHYAFYNPTKGRIEMHLISQIDQDVSIGEFSFSFTQGENIHTENSYKYTANEFLTLAGKAGWKVVRKWLGGKQMFSIFLLQAHD